MAEIDIGCATSPAHRRDLAISDFNVDVRAQLMSIEQDVCANYQRAFRLLGAC